MDPSIAFEIHHRPDFALLKVELAAGQRIMAEPSAMISMDPSIRLKSGLKGGLLKSLGRAFGGESLIINTFTADNSPGEVLFAPGPMGDIHHYHLQGGNELLVQRGGYLANTDGVEVTGKWQGAKGFFSGEGLILLKASGQGDIFFNTYGAVIEIDVNGGYVVDTGYIVAFESTLSYRVGILPGQNMGSKIKSFVFGGESLVCHFSGAGKLWIQTRAIAPFIRWVWPYRPQKKRD